MAVAAAAAGLLFAVAPPANAGSGLAMNVDVTNSRVAMQSVNGDSCTWEVSSDVTVVNLTSRTLDVTAVEGDVFWTGPDNSSGAQRGVPVLDDGGLRPGVTLASHEQRTFSPFVTRFDIPCNATFGDVDISVTTPQGTGSGDAPFLENGTPVPVGAVGAVGLAGILGAGLLVHQRRRRTQPLPVN
jgi:hypothetical protein